MMINPILKGFCPDPSIIRTGRDYYIATSTFEWWPGVKLFHSIDLQNWEQIASPLRRTSQLDLTGDPPSGGVWAPDLSFDGERFYLVYTDVKTKKGKWYNTHNYLVTATDIAGEWSEPVYLNSIGFDPSLFHDTNGKKYLVNMINGFKGIVVQELDENFHLTGERKMVYQGTTMGYTEGPHIYHIGRYYYLMVAEGGTGYEHGITLARADHVFGPYETAPENPLLTSDRVTQGALQKCGHGDLVETMEHEWYLVHLCARPVPGTNWCSLGRETAIQKVVFGKDGWLKLKSGGQYGEWVTEEVKSEQKGFLQTEDTSNGFFYDDFDGEQLDVRYSSPRRDYREFCSLQKRKGFLSMTGQESLNSLHRVSLLAVRQQSFFVRAETAIEFFPDYEEQVAGLTCFYDSNHFYLLAMSGSEEQKRFLHLWKSDHGEITEVALPISLAQEMQRLYLRIRVLENGLTLVFEYSVDQIQWERMGERYSTELVSDEYCRGFTGTHFGLYVHDMTGLSCQADFDYFCVQQEEGEM